MGIDEIENTPLSDLTEAEFQHVADGIAHNSDLMLRHSDEFGENFDLFVDDSDFEYFVSRKLTASEVFKLAQVIMKGEQSEYGAFFTERPFYDRKRAAAGDND